MTLLLRYHQLVSALLAFVENHPRLFDALLFRFNLFAFIAAPPRLHPVSNWHLGTGQEQADNILKARKRAWRVLEYDGVPRPIHWLRGLKIYAHPYDETSRALFLTGMFEPNEFVWLERTLKPGMVMIDVGANMGLYTLFAARCVGQSGSILAVEPSSREFQRLQMNMRLNRLANIHAVQAAAYNHAGEADLRVAAVQNAGHNTLGQFGYEGVDTARFERVHLICLDDLIHQSNLLRVDVVKIDTEGAERFVLEGAQATIQRFHPLFLIELSDRMLQHQSSDTAQIVAFFKQHGYTLYEFSGDSELLRPLLSKSQYHENIVAVYSN